MAEVDEISCVQSQFQPRAPRAIRFFIYQNTGARPQRGSVLKDGRFRRISSCFRLPKFQILPGEHATGPPYYVHALPFSSLKRKATNKITDKWPVHSFVYNLTILMRKQKCKQGMQEVGEPRGQDIFGKKYHGYDPESQVQTSLQAQRCRVQCYEKAFLKKARACTCHTLHTGSYSDLVLICLGLFTRMYYKMKWLFPCYCFSWISIYELNCFHVLKNVYYTVGINEILTPIGTGIYYIRVLQPS